MKPPIRWAGSKRRLVDHIVPLIGNPKRYVEPFCGSAAIFFALERDGESLLNDTSEAIIRALKGIAKSPLKTTTHLMGLRKTQARRGHQKFYKQLVKTLDITLPPDAYAATFIALNQTSFNGLWRVNRQGYYNVPIGYRTIGGQKVPYDIDPIILTDYSKLLKKAKITCGDFRTISLGPGDLSYCDPPYLNQFSSYAKDGFNETDHRDLMDWIHQQVNNGARVILSGAGNDKTREIYGPPTYVVGRECTIGASNRKATTEFIYVFE